MCLVAFQKNFRKIFSDVWKRRMKKQNPEKHGQNPEKKSSNPVKLREEGRERGDWVRRGARSHGRGEDHDQREGEIVIDGTIFLPLRVCELSLRVPSSGNHLK